MPLPMLRPSTGWVIVFLVALVCLGALSVEAQRRKKNYYDLLDVAKDASAKDIKRAYFKVAMKYHPDKNPDVHDRSTLEKHFSDLSHAYQVLSTPKTREKYDQLLKQGVIEYTTEDMKRDEQDAELGGIHPRTSFDVFEEALVLTEEEEAQERREKLLLLAMSLGLAGIGAWWLWRKKIIKLGAVNSSTALLSQAIVADRDRQQQLSEKQRAKYEKQRALADMIQGEVQRMREELYWAALKQEELRAPEETAAAAANAAESPIIPSPPTDSDITKLSTDGTLHQDDISDPGAADQAKVRDDALEDSAVSLFKCKPCRKTFKSQGQWDNHVKSKKHKEAMKNA